MENTNRILHKIILPLILLTLVPEIYADSPYKKTIYNTFINREMYKWGNIIHTIETSKPPTTIDQKLELINYYYGYIGYLIGKKQYDIAGNMITKGEKLIHQVMAASPRNATAYAYKGSFMGFRVAISKLKTLSLSYESLAEINHAYKLDPQNVQALIDKGNILYYSPKLFGGDKEEALTYYLRGERILERNKDTDQSWFYLNILTNIALAYEKTDRPEDAKHIYEKILQKEPNYKWVRDILYPKILEKTR
ncbi:MAG: hypothetical protein Q8904_07100 [Bacteroidota bacterium]|nr:hypothetical protein [Bacteroidota bacterium]